MIHLTRFSDSMPIAINPFHVFVMEPLGEEGCRITSAGGTAYEVAESMLQVEKLVKRWTKNEVE